MSTASKISLWLLLLLVGIPLIIVLTMIRPDMETQVLMEKYTDEESKFLNMDGINIHYKDEGSGTPIVLIHGILSSLHTWDGWANSLKKHYRVIRLDLPCFGLTGPDPNCDCNIDYYVHIIKILSETLELEKFYLGGNSLGGLISWKYVLSYPEDVLKLILVDSAGIPKEDPFFKKLANIPILREIASLVSPRFLVGYVLEDVYGNDALITETLVDRYYELNRREGNRVCFLQMMSQLSLTPVDNLNQIHIPVLIQWGKLDRWIPVEHAYQFAERIPNAQVIVYDEAGHVPMEEIPEETVQDAIGFFKTSD